MIDLALKTDKELKESKFSSNHIYGEYAIIDSSKKEFMFEEDKI